MNMFPTTRAILPVLARTPLEKWTGEVVHTPRLAQVRLAAKFTDRVVRLVCATITNAGSLSETHHIEG